MRRLLTSVLCTLAFMPVAALAKAPVLYIVGDSTVESREGAGADEQQGWGGKIDQYFGSGIKVRNFALGGTSSRSFRSAGHWQKVLDELEKGDFVLIQFGHNDGGGLVKNKDKASLKGMGDETEEVTKDDGESETVHSYGWYIRQYAREARDKGATVIVCSPVPRCLWSENGKVGRSDKDYGGWAREVATEEKAFFIDLNAIVADRYDEIGDEEKVRASYFADHHTHTNRAGAELNAECVIAGLRGQRNCPLYNFLNSKGQKVKPARD